jgi:dolichol-phosphate mannosyltransferase
MSNKLTILLPVYHEEENIQRVVSLIERHVKTPHTIMIIYDTKEDPTVLIVKKLQENNSHILIEKNMYGTGIVNALKTGFKKARSDILLIMMADLSDNPKDIDKMVKKIDEGYDLVCASRYSANGRRVGGPVVKGFLSYLSCISLAMFTGIPTNDATNAFKMFRKDLIKTIQIESVGGFELPLELTVKAFVSGKSIAEIPTVWRERKTGKSKFKLLQWLPQYLKWYFYALTRVKFKT